MSDRHWPRPVLATTALGLLAAAVTGCGNSAGTSQAGATRTAGAAVATGQSGFTAAQLKEALLKSVSGARPASPAQAGDYGALPDVQTSKQTMKGVKVSPARCAQATVTGFNSAAFTHAPASVVTFRVGRDGVSEVLVSATSQVAAAAFGHKVPAGCSHYTAAVGGRTFRYSVSEHRVAGLGDQARSLNVRAAGYPQVDVWSVVYRASGFVGAVTMVGPDASEQGVKEVARQSYARAARSLS
jgi:hypothetical protein